MAVEIIQGILILLGAIAYLAFPIWLMGPICEKGWHRMSFGPYIISAGLSLYLIAGLGVMFKIFF